MTSMYCEREPETVRATGRGSCSPDLLHHIEHCPACTEARHIAQLLLPDAALLQSTLNLPQATRVWEKARSRAQTSALERASCVQAVLKAASFIYAAIFVIWSIRTFPILKHYSNLPVVSGEAASTSIAAAVFAASCIVSGLWYMLRKDKRENTLTHSGLG